MFEKKLVMLARRSKVANCFLCWNGLLQIQSLGSFTVGEVEVEEQLKAE